MTAPSLHIVLELEAKPRSYSDCPHEGDDVRLADWLGSLPEADELCELLECWKTSEAV